MSVPSSLRSPVQTEPERQPSLRLTSTTSPYVSSRRTASRASWVSKRTTLRELRTRCAGRLWHGVRALIFETVFSDPAGDKLGFLSDAAAAGYAVVLCFVGISSPSVSEARVAMRVSQGGHDVPTDKLASRFPRTMANLAEAVRALPYVLVFDNDDLARPYRLAAVFEQGKVVSLNKPVPTWVKPLL